MDTIIIEEAIARTTKIFYNAPNKPTQRSEYIVDYLTCRKLK
jgi:hypothetical protein